jgi:hypothetical protein
MHKFEFKESVRVELATTPEARLFHSILLRAVDDAINGYGANQQSAINWLWEKDNAIRNVCLIFSDYDIQYVRNTIKKQLGEKFYSIKGIVYGNA